MIRGAKACPFCGNLEGLVWFHNSSESEANDIDEILAECGVASVCCSMHDGGCGAASGYAGSEEKILVNWNTRASPIWIKMKE